MNRDELEKTIRDAIFGYIQLHAVNPTAKAAAEAVWAKMQEGRAPESNRVCIIDPETGALAPIATDRDYWSREFAKVAFMCLLGHGDWRSRIEVLVREARDVGRRMAEAMEEE